MRLTWISGTLAGIGVLVTDFNDNIIKIFGVASRGLEFPFTHDLGVLPLRSP